MKSTQFYIALAAGAACLVLSVILIGLGQSTQHLQQNLQKRQNEIQQEMQQRQMEIQRGKQSDEIGGRLLQDLAAASVKNERIRDMLLKNGYKVTADAAPGQTPATSPTP